jgi:Domain of unknown function (DUF4062)
MNSVFISSRFRHEPGLSELRRLLTEELTKRFSNRPLNLDDARADSRDPETRSFDELRAADLVVLLLCGTCGAADASGRSLTEREFDAALKASLPVLAYRQPDGSAEDERARTFRRHVAEHVTVGVLTGSAAVDAAAIVADIYECMKPRKVETPSTSSVVIGGNASVVGSTIAGGNIVTRRSDDV